MATCISTLIPFILFAHIKLSSYLRNRSLFNLLTVLLVYIKSILDPLSKNFSWSCLDFSKVSIFFLDLLFNSHAIKHIKSHTSLLFMQTSLFFLNHAIDYYLYTHSFYSPSHPTINFFLKSYPNLFLSPALLHKLFANPSVECRWHLSTQLIFAQKSHLFPNSTLHILEYKPLRKDHTMTRRGITAIRRNLRVGVIVLVKNSYLFSICSVLLGLPYLFLEIKVQISPN